MKCLIVIPLYTNCFGTWCAVAWYLDKQLMKKGLACVHPELAIQFNLVDESQVTQCN